MDKSFPNLEMETDIQAQEAQAVQSKMNPKRPTSRYMAKVKDKETIWNKARKKMSYIQRKAHKAIS